MNHRSLIQGLPVLLGLLCAGPAPAQDRSASQSKVYMGGAIGRVGYDTDFERTKAVIRSTGATSFTVAANGTDTAWKGYFGYAASRHFFSRSLSAAPRMSPSEAPESDEP